MDGGGGEGEAQRGDRPRPHGGSADHHQERPAGGGRGLGRGVGAQDQALRHARRVLRRLPAARLRPHDRSPQGCAAHGRSVNYLLDTNVVSEWTKPRPDPGVTDWLADADEDRVYLSVVTLAELRHGVERLADGARKARLDRWLTDELLLRFEGRVLAI